MSMFKKVVLSSTILLMVLALFSEITGAQLFPFIVFFVLVYRNEKEKKDVRFWIIMLAILMAVLNIGIESYMDIIVWTLIATAWWKKDLTSVK